ncbi:AMP-binding protein [Brenneria tiliae]|uniref:AMP-binding protein n=1 Tax=Brenneria tiliae TaxID=2914984 RepID=A0ABT0MVU8_9GAMM|nr:AMP-binding protein [Brenneria tiliae]MCL2893979.1 AMP-binding protein [Brenneria tiliae]
MELLNITTGETLDIIARQNAARVALIESNSGRTLTWQTLKEKVDGVAKGFLAMGLVKGDKLAIWSVNNIEWVICFLAAANIGVVVVCIDFHLKKPELINLLHITNTRALCFSRGFRENDFAQIAASLAVDKSAENRGAVCLDFLIDIENRKHPNMLSLDDIEERGDRLDAAQYEQATASVAAGELLTIQMTSGSTASPKCVMLSHHSIINNSRLSARRLDITPDDIICLTVPFFHCFGLSSGLFFSLNTGCRLVLQENYRPEEVLKAVEKYQCSVMHGVPTVFSRLMKHENFERYDVKSLNKGIVAGAYCHPDLIKDITTRLAMQHISVAYGQTETSPCCTQTQLTDPLAVKSATVGKPLPHIEMKIVDLKTRQVCPVGVPGEICSRGFHVMMGYYNAREETEKVIDAQGWFHTGDIGILDESGYYRYSHRIKEIIVRGGENISPREVEAAILAYPGIETAKVFGLREDELGEEVAAAICPKIGVDICEAELRGFLETHLAHYKVPSYIYVMKNITYTPSGKIDCLAMKNSIVNELIKNNVVKISL